MVLACRALWSLDLDRVVGHRCWTDSAKPLSNGVGGVFPNWSWSRLQVSNSATTMDRTGSRFYAAATDRCALSCGEHRQGSHDSTGVEVFVQGGQQIGHLSAQVAAEVAPLLDSDRANFDAEIWSIDEFTAGDGRKLLACTIAMTQFERVPVKRFLWTLALLIAVRRTAATAKWTVDRGSSTLGWLGRSVITAIRFVIPHPEG